MSRVEERPGAGPAATTVATESTELAVGSIKGQSVPRREDQRLVQGQGLFVDDVRRHGMGYIHLVRSPYAHAKIASIDVSQALALPGVYGTLTGDEVAILTEPFFEIAPPPGAAIQDYCMAVGKVRYAGEPVVAVVASSRELAADAAELVEIEYEPLEIVLSPEQALAEGAPLLHEGVGSNVVWSGVYDFGDVDGALAAADHVVTIKRLHFDRHSCTPLECSGAVCEYDRATKQWTLYCNHQMPGVASVWMGPALRCGQDKLRFVTADIGGGFGNKIITHTYLTICALLARKLNRPVKWTEYRTDQHMGNSHSNERTFTDVQVAVSKDGDLLGFKAKAFDDCGAYPRYEPLGCVIWSQVTAGCYRWRHVQVDFTQTVTNKSPVGPDRGYSRLQHLWLLERIVDTVCGELGFNPVEFRKRNYVRAEEMPYETPNGCVYDSGDYARCLEIALELVDYEGWQARREEFAAQGKLLGIGIGSTLDSGTNNFGQSRILNPELQFSGNNEVATAKLDSLGEIVVTLGTVPQGQGHETTAAQVVADILGCPFELVDVQRGHDSAWNSHAGFSGTYASQFAVTGLGAVKGAAEGLALQMKRLAAVILGADGPEAIVLEDAMAKRRDNPEAALPFVALGAIVNLNNAGLPAELDDCTMNVRYVYRPHFEQPDIENKRGNLTLTYATQIHACVVAIDRETGVLELLDYAAVDDCGTRINPMIVEGQVHGAVAHGVGAALWETFEYNEAGQLLTANFYDYHVPHALDMPDLKTGHLESPSPFTPLGSKGMGEGGGGAIGTICAAIQDALRAAGGGAHVNDSFNPSLRIWEMLRDPGSTRANVEVVSR